MVCLCQKNHPLVTQSSGRSREAYVTVGVLGDTWAPELGRGRSPGSLGLTNSSGDEERKPRGRDTQSHSESSAAVTFRTFHEIRHGILQPAGERQQLCAPRRAARRSEVPPPSPKSLLHNWGLVWPVASQGSCAFQVPPRDPQSFRVHWQWVCLPFLFQH